MLMTSNVAPPEIMMQVRSVTQMDEALRMMLMLLLVLRMAKLMKTVRVVMLHMSKRMNRTVDVHTCADVNVAVVDALSSATVSV